MSSTPDNLSTESPTPRPPGMSRLRGFIRDLGLQGKLVVGFGILLLAGFSVTSWLFISRSRGAVSDMLGEQARQISQTLALAAEAPYLTDDPERLASLGRDLLKSRNIVLVAFFDSEGHPIGAECRDLEFNIDQWEGRPNFTAGTQHLLQPRERFSPALGEYVQVTAPVFQLMSDAARQRPGNPMRRLLGYLTIGISQNYEQSQLRGVSLMGIGVGVLVLVLSLPLALVLVHRIFLPIRQLVDATNRIAGGEYDTQVATERPDEIGMLARSFNGMVDRIREHQEALRIANDGLADANRDLEAKVKARTGELESANARLSSEIAEKEDFLRAVSHDLNAPLRNISGMATMLLMKHRDRFDEEIIHRLERIQKNVEVETDLISELLELSRIKTRRQKMEEIDLDALVRSVGEVFEDDLRSKNISLIVEPPPLPKLLCERARMRQVFQNLIDNAIKYMGESSVREIRIGWRPAGNEVEFFVRDTGIGIDAEECQKVFYIFRRGKNTADVNVPGKGVGLASVKSIIQTYDGRIWVQSAVGEGSTFHFTIHSRFAPELKPLPREVDEPVVEPVAM